MVDWLEDMSVDLKIHPLELKSSSRLASACVKLIASATFLQEIFRVENNHLQFAESVSPDDAKQTILYVKENHHPTVRFTPR